MQTLKLSLETAVGFVDERPCWDLPPESPIDIPRECTLPAVLQSLILEVVAKSKFALVRGIPSYTQWIDDDVLPPVTGLGGPDLKNVDVLFVQLESKLERERMVRRRWVKSPNGDWLMEECH